MITSRASVVPSVVSWTLPPTFSRGGTVLRVPGVTGDVRGVDPKGQEGPWR